MVTPRPFVITLSVLAIAVSALLVAPVRAQSSESTRPAPSASGEAASATPGCCCAGPGCACCGGDDPATCGGHGCGQGPAAQARGMGGHGCRMGGMQGGARAEMPPAGRGMGGMGAGQPALMHTAMSLVHQRQNIERTVEEIPGGVRTRTVVKGDDPALVATLVEHVEGMAGLLERGGRVRNWDPLFSELFDHASAITLDIEELPDGVLVVETSDDAEVAKLIRAHAYKVNEFLARGHGAVHESTPIPADYHGSGSSQTPE